MDCLSLLLETGLFFLRDVDKERSLPLDYLPLDYLPLGYLSLVKVINCYILDLISAISFDLRVYISKFKANQLL
jgi:hypothetical protein